MAVIPRGAAQTTIDVAVRGDRRPEAEEYFEVVLDAALGARLADDRARGTIRDGD